MTDATIPRAIVAPSVLDPVLVDAIRGRRCLLVAGLPGAGKSLFVQRAAAVARDAGRDVHLLQWDVARLPFDTPEILGRYPEVGGVTHAGIRVAVGRWAREAVRTWHASHGDGALLVGETPLVGERFASLARPSDDDAEPLLASEATLFLVPVPTAQVRARIEAARAREMDSPLHARDLASAPPALVRWHWDDLVAVARALGIAPSSSGGYDPDLYARVYFRALRHRHARIVDVTEVIDAPGTVHLTRGAQELVPSDRDVRDAMAWVEGLPPGAVERAAAEWYGS